MLLFYLRICVHNRRFGGSSFILERIIKIRIDRQDNEFKDCYVELCALITEPKVSHTSPNAKSILLL